MKTAKDLSNEVREKLIALDRYTSILWDMSNNDPKYQETHDICRSIQLELMGEYGLTPAMINQYTYGEGGVLFG